MTISDERLAKIVSQGADLIWISADASELFDALRELQSRRSALAQPSAPEGWVMVPVKPTREMLDIINTMRGPAYIYRDLIDARPLPPAPTAEEV